MGHDGSKWSSVEFRLTRQRAQTDDARGTECYSGPRLSNLRIAGGANLRGYTDGDRCIRHVAQHDRVRTDADVAADDDASQNTSAGSDIDIVSNAREARPFSHPNRDTAHERDVGTDSVRHHDCAYGMRNVESRTNWDRGRNIESVERKVEL